MDVIVSARGDHLASAPAHWRHGLSRGAWWLRLGVILAIPFVYPGILVSCLGLWFLTRAQPHRDEPALDRSFRLTTRWVGGLGGAVIVCLALGALIALASGGQRLFDDWRYNGLPIFDVLWLVAHAVWVLGLLSAWRYLRVLAQRVPDNDLATSFRGLGRCWVWAVLIVAVINGTTFGLIQLNLLPGGSTSPWVALALSLIHMVILTSLWVATLRVVARQAAVLRAVADDG